MAINPGLHGRPTTGGEPAVHSDLCDVCYWRVEAATWRQLYDMQKEHNETESVLRESFKVILGDQYRDDLHLCRLAGLVENRLLILNRTGWQVSFDLCDRLRYELSKKLIKVFTSEAETILLTVRDLIDDENKPQGADGKPNTQDQTAGA
jgi:hypothetical protein